MLCIPSCSLPYSCERSLIVDKPMAEVVEFVSDFNTWRTWSPWIIQDPSCPVVVAGTPGQVGHSQSWDGQYMGCGEMVLDEISPTQIGYEFSFVKPWKSSSEVQFKFKAVGNEKEEKTEVTWIMNGTVPLFLFFLRNRISCFVGHDYERGLSMLKELMETGHVSSKVEILGPTANDKEEEGFEFVGIRTKCRTDDVGRMMRQDFDRLQDLLSGTKPKLPIPDFSISFYNDWDIVRHSCDYTAGFGYYRRGDGYKSLEVLPQHVLDDGGLVRMSIPNHRAFRVSHVGSYRHLGNAWGAAMRRVQNGCGGGGGGMRQAKSIATYEVYENCNSGKVEEKDLITTIYIPLK